MPVTEQRLLFGGRSLEPSERRVATTRRDVEIAPGCRLLVLTMSLEPSEKESDLNVASMDLKTMETWAFRCTIFLGMDLEGH